MQILNFGNFIENGEYNIHSQFDKVVNFQNNDQIISLVTPEVGYGPNNIVCSQMLNVKNEKLTVEKFHVSIGNTKLSKPNSNLILENNLYVQDVVVLKERLQALLSKFRNYVSQKSLAFLLHPEFIEYFKTKFEIKYVEYVLEIMKTSFCKLPHIASKMKGIGFGLTPSGDDFNCGALYALHYINAIGSYNFSNVIYNYKKNSIGENLISNTFLKFAFLNQYYEAFYNLLFAIKKGNEYTLHIKRLVQSGHTSGSDFLTGFIFIMKGVLYDKKFC